MMPADPTREEVEEIIACAEHHSPALEANEIRRLGTLALRQMEEIEKLRADRDHWKGVVVEVQSDAAVAESNCDHLTADLAAARAALDQVEALAKDWEGTADMFDARTIGGSAAGNTIRRMVSELRAALRGEGAKSHVVDWCGVYRGTESDPREVGYCQTCEREVYDGEAGHSAALAPKEDKGG